MLLIIVLFCFFVVTYRGCDRRKKNKHNKNCYRVQMYIYIDDNGDDERTKASRWRACGNVNICLIGHSVIILPWQKRLERSYSLISWRSVELVSGIIPVASKSSGGMRSSLNKGAGIIPGSHEGRQSSPPTGWSGYQSPVSRRIAAHPPPPSIRVSQIDFHAKNQSLTYDCDRLNSIAPDVPS